MAGLFGEYGGKISEPAKCVNTMQALANQPVSEVIMDESNYKRLSCGVFSCGKDHKANGLCQMHCQQVRRHGQIGRLQKNCACCGKAFEASQSNAIYCSSVCKQRAFTGKNPEKVKTYRESQKVSPAVLRKRAIAAIRSAISKLSTQKRLEEKRLSDGAERMKINSSVLCEVCGGECGYVFGRIRRFCSKSCMRSTEHFKEGRRAHKAKRKAQSKGLHSESFSPKSVLDRDGWKCQICGVSTPKSRRGTLHPNAPELDHIKPLSKGGHHTMANTQCACRKCNQWKSDKFVVGQVGLFA